MKTEDVRVGGIYGVSSSRFAFANFQAWGQVIDGPLPMDKPGRYGFVVEMLNGKYAGERFTLTAASFTSGDLSTRKGFFKRLAAHQAADQLRRNAWRTQQLLGQLGVTATAHTSGDKVIIRVSGEESGQLVEQLETLIAQRAAR